MMRWFTCTPREFGGGPDFFARDSGLLCRGFQSIGIESRAIMPGPRQNGDEEDLIRTDYRNLESTKWWMELGIDGIVLYAWGSPRYRKIAKAIRRAGIFLVLNQDNSGLVSPLTGFRYWLQEQSNLTGHRRNPKAVLSYLFSVARGCSIGILRTDLLRAMHLRQGNLISCVSPIAAERYRRLTKVYGGKKLASVVEVLPHAVESLFSFNGEHKKPQILCVGRWEDEIQKRPSLLRKVSESIVSSDENTSIVIVGNPTSTMTQWHKTLPVSIRERIRLYGFANRSELSYLMRESSIFYSPSAYESFGIAAAEALCSGCSVVAARSVSMASFDWFVSEHSGTLADSDTLQGHIETLQKELVFWQNGSRAPKSISETWSQRLHENHVASEVIRLYHKTVGSN